MRNYCDMTIVLVSTTVLYKSNGIAISLKVCTIFTSELKQYLILINARKKLLRNLSYYTT